MCGASSQQTQIEQEQLQAYQQLQQLTSEQYANQQALYAPMAKQLQGIFALGPNQQGFSAAETANLNAQATEGTAQNYAAAGRAVNQQIAASGGGNISVPSGAQQQLQAEVAASAANTQSAEETQIAQANYQQGYNEWQAAGSGLEAIASGENPLGYGSEATSAGNAASNTANQIAQENNSWINAALGAAGGIGGALIGANPGDIFG